MTQGHQTARQLDRARACVKVAEIALEGSYRNLQCVIAERLVIRQRLDDLYALSRLILARKDNGSFWQIMHAALQRCLAADRCVLVGVDNAGNGKPLKRGHRHGRLYAVAIAAMFLA